jgi:tRNA A37 threonylcarbamoyladenosine modification protein TsaB
MSHYIILQYPYETIDIALCVSGNIISFKSLHKHQAIGETIPTIQELLGSHNLKLSDLICIGVNVGPGPYNTLRGILTMMNAIATVTKIPLISMSALDLINKQYQTVPHVAILQAFENHVFFSFSAPSRQLQGACTIADLIEFINQTVENLHVYGNGGTKYQQILTSSCHNKLIFTEPLIPFNSLDILAQATYWAYQQKHPSNKLLKPIYFEDLAAKFKTTLS